jgi:hypothetical protein
MLGPTRAFAVIVPMRITALTLLALAACDRPRDDARPGYAPLPHPTPPRDAAPAPDAPPPPPLAPTLSDAFRELATTGSPPRICFAVSANRRRAACARGAWSSQLGHTLTITIVGEIGDARSEWTYHAIEGMSSYPRRDELTAPAELDAAHQALLARGYKPAIDPQVPLLNHTTLTFGPWTFRRALITTGEISISTGSWNEYEEHVDVRCGKDRWVPVDIVNTRYDEPRIWLARLNDRVMLVTVDSHWCIEGECGGARAAYALDVAALCRGS